MVEVFRRTCDVPTPCVSLNTRSPAVTLVGLDASGATRRNQPSPHGVL